MPQSVGHFEAAVPLSVPSSHFSPGSVWLSPQKGAITRVQIAEHGEPGMPLEVPRSHSSLWREAFTGRPFRNTFVFVSRTPLPQSPGGGTQPCAQVTPGLRGQDLSFGSQRQAVPIVPGARLHEAEFDVQVWPRSHCSPVDTTPSPHSGSLQRPFTQPRAIGQF